MNKNERKQSTVLEMLFMYLVITKVLYFFNTFYAFIQDGLDLGTAAEAFLIRFLNQDFMIIVGVLIFYKLEKVIDKKKSKDNTLLATIMFYVIGYVLLMGASLAYSYIINTITGQIFNLDEFFYFLRLSIFWYIIIIVVLNLKYLLKSKEKKLYEINPANYSEDEKTYMLEVLFRDGLLTQEEFDSKKEKVLTS